MENVDQAQTWGPGLHLINATKMALSLYHLLSGDRGRGPVDVAEMVYTGAWPDATTQMMEEQLGKHHEGKWRYRSGSQNGGKIR